MSRALLVVVAALAALALGTLQVTSTIALRHDAAPGAWVTFVPPGIGAAVDRLDPALPLPEPLRLVLARSALARGDDALAAAHAARLPPSRDRFALLGTLAAHRGDLDGAVRDALAAGDLPALERRVDARAAAGDWTAAFDLQNATLKRLGDDRADEDALAEAYFRLGLLHQSRAYALPVLAMRLGDERASYVAYLHAVDLAPLSARYLLGAASEALNVDDLAGAKGLFDRARVADPTNAAALAGLGEAAYRAGDRHGAADALARAERLDPGSGPVARLRGELGRTAP